MSLESLYGIYLEPPAKALMQFPRAKTKNNHINMKNSTELSHRRKPANGSYQKFNKRRLKKLRNGTFIKKLVGKRLKSCGKVTAKKLHLVHCTELAN